MGRELRTKLDVAPGLPPLMVCLRAKGAFAPSSRTGTPLSSSYPTRLALAWPKRTLAMEKAWAASKPVRPMSPVKVALPGPAFPVGIFDGKALRYSAAHHRNTFFRLRAKSANRTSICPLRVRERGAVGVAVSARL